MSHGGSLNSARSECTQNNSVLFSLALNIRDHNINNINPPTVISRDAFVQCFRFKKLLLFHTYIYMDKY